MHGYAQVHTYIYICVFNISASLTDAMMISELNNQPWYADAFKDVVTAMSCNKLSWKTHHLSHSMQSHWAHEKTTCREGTSKHPPIASVVVTTRREKWPNESYHLSMRHWHLQLRPDNHTPQYIHFELEPFSYRDDNADSTVLLTPLRPLLPRPLSFPRITATV